MDIKEMKKFLAKDYQRVEKLLEYFSFHGFNYPEDDELRCALPDGNNATSVLINLDENLFGIVFSRGNFKSDIFGIIAKFANRSKRDVFSITRLLFNLPGYKSTEVRVDILKGLRSYKNNKRRTKNVNNKKFDEGSVLAEYIRLPHKSIIEEGISFDVCRKYNICYDPQSDRIIFPHYDWAEHDKVVGLQARTTMDSDTAKLLGVSKYTNFIRGYKKEANLYGYNFNKEAIENSKMLILFEGEKSVLRLSTFHKGEDVPAVAVGGHFLSNQQIKFIVANTPLETEIIFAFDNDVVTDEVEFTQLEEIMKKVNMFRKVSYIRDPFEGKLMSGTDSPVDKGKSVWDYLLSERVVYK